MIKKLKNIFVAIAMMGATTAPVLLPAAASAQIADPIQSGTCAGVDLSLGTSGSCTPDPTAGQDKLNNIIRLVINIFSLIVGVVSIIMIIIGGLRYITSGGESSNISSAKNTIIYAIIGLVIVALAQFIVHFVLGRVTAA